MIDGIKAFASDKWLGDRQAICSKRSLRTNGRAQHQARPVVRSFRFSRMVRRVAWQAKQSHAMPFVQSIRFRQMVGGRLRGFSEFELFDILFECMLGSGGVAWWPGGRSKFRCGLGSAGNCGHAKFGLKYGIRL